MDEIELAEQLAAALINAGDEALADLEVATGEEAGLPRGMPAFLLYSRHTGRQFVVTVKERRVGEGYTLLPEPDPEPEPEPEPPAPPPPPQRRRIRPQ
jgi:hypothetical protein